MSAEDYNPPQTPRGEQILKFATRDGESATNSCVLVALTNDSCVDAEEFLNVIDEITMNLLR